MCPGMQRRVLSAAPASFVHPAAPHWASTQPVRGHEGVGDSSGRNLSTSCMCLCFFGTEKGASSGGRCSICLLQRLLLSHFLLPQLIFMHLTSFLLLDPGVFLFFFSENVLCTLQTSGWIQDSSVMVPVKPQGNSLHKQKRTLTYVTGHWVCCQIHVKPSLYFSIILHSVGKCQCKYLPKERKDLKQ